MEKDRKHRTRNIVHTINNFSGLATTLPKNVDSLTFADVANNVSYNADGSISKREGIKKYFNAQYNIDDFIINDVAKIKINGQEIGKKTFIDGKFYNTNPGEDFIIDPVSLKDKEGVYKKLMSDNTKSKVQFLYVKRIAIDNPDHSQTIEYHIVENRNGSKLVKLPAEITNATSSRLSMDEDYLYYLDDTDEKVYRYKYGLDTIVKDTTPTNFKHVPRFFYDYSISDIKNVNRISAKKYTVDFNKCTYEEDGREKIVSLPNEIVDVGFINGKPLFIYASIRKAPATINLMNKEIVEAAVGDAILGVIEYAEYKYWYEGKSGDTDIPYTRYNAMFTHGWNAWINNEYDFLYRHINYPIIQNHSDTNKDKINILGYMYKWENDQLIKDTSIPFNAYETGKLTDNTIGATEQNEIDLGYLFQSELPKKDYMIVTSDIDGEKLFIKKMIPWTFSQKVYGAIKFKDPKDVVRHEWITDADSHATSLMAFSNNDFSGSLLKTDTILDLHNITTIAPTNEWMLYYDTVRELKSMRINKVEIGDTKIYRAEGDYLGNTKIDIIFEDKKLIFYIDGKICNVIVDNQVYTDYQMGDRKVYSHTNVEGKIFLSIDDDILVIESLEVDADTHYIYVSSITDASYKPSLQEAQTTGFNIVDPSPLRLAWINSNDWFSHVNKEIDGFIRDIIVNKQNSEEVVSHIETDQHYDLYANFVGKDYKSISNAKYTWKLFKYDITSLTWSLQAGKIVKEVVPGATVESNKAQMAVIPEEGKYKITLSIATDVDKKDPADTTAREAKTYEFEYIFTTVNETWSHLKNISFADKIKKCKYVHSIDGRLVAYGDGDQNIYISNEFEPTYFTASNIINANSFGYNQDIIAIATYKDTYVIFTDSTMMSLKEYVKDDGTSVWGVLPLDGTTGVVGHKAIVPIENTLAFVDRNGIYTIKQISVADHRVDLEKMSVIVEDLASPLMLSNGDKTVMNDVEMFDTENKLFITYPQKNYTLVFDYSSKQGKWSKWKIADKFAIHNIHGYKGKMYFTSDLNNTDIFIKRDKLLGSEKLLDNHQSYFMDEDHRYTFKYKTYDNDFGDNMILKKIKRAVISVDNNYEGNYSINIKAYSDGDKFNDYTFESGIYERDILTGETIGPMRTYDNIINKIYMISDSGRTVSVSIDDADHDYFPSSINKIDLEIITSKRKGNLS